MAGKDHGWYVGDRVELSPTGRQRDTVMATIVGFDDVPNVPGVRVEMDRPIRGETTAYASYNELTRMSED